MNPRRRHDRFTAVLIAVTCAATSCSKGTGRSATTAAAESNRPATVTATSGNATSDNTTSDNTTAQQNGSLTSRATTLPRAGGACAITRAAVDPLGEITFVESDKLFTTDSLGRSSHCLLDLRNNAVTSLSWSPSGARLLLDGDVVADANGVRVSGFLPTNSDVQWSGPNGTSLLASTAAGRLVKRNSTTSARTDVTFLDRHDSSAYHPAGKAIISLGSGFDANTAEKTVGVWLADNGGRGSRLLVRDESAAAIGEPRFDSSGAKLYFLAAHAGGTSHVHVYDIEGGTLEVAYQAKSAFDRLVTSGVDEDTWAVRVGDCSAKASVVAAFGSEPLPLNQPELNGQAVEPVGWLANRVLLVIARPQGCTGPGSLWRISDVGLGVKIADNVSAAAPRTVRALAKELSIPLGRQVVA